MHQFMVGWGAKLVGDDPEAALDEVMDELLACRDLIDPCMDYNTETREVGFDVTVEAEDPLDALVKALTLIRTALHAARIGTPGWPHASDLRASLDDWQQSGPVRQLIDA